MASTNHSTDSEKQDGSIQRGVMRCQLLQLLQDKVLEEILALFTAQASEDVFSRAQAVRAHNLKPQQEIPPASPMKRPRIGPQLDRSSIDAPPSSAAAEVALIVAASIAVACSVRPKRRIRGKQRACDVVGLTASHVRTAVRKGENKNQRTRVKEKEKKDLAYARKERLQRAFAARQSQNEQTSATSMPTFAHWSEAIITEAEAHPQDVDPVTPAYFLKIN